MIGTADSAAGLRPVTISYLPKQVLLRAFKPGSVMLARVIARLDASNYVVRLAQYRFLTSSTVPLVPGQSIRVQVEHLNPKLQLRLLPEKKTQRQASAPKIIVESPLQRDPENTLHLFFSENLATGEHRVRAIDPSGKRSKERKKVTSFVMHFDSSTTGQMEVHLVQCEACVWITFLGDRLPWLHHLKQKFADLQQQIRQLTSMEAHVAARLLIASERAVLQDGREKLNIVA